MKIKKGLVIQKMGSDFVVYDNENSTIHELNETAVFILKKLQKGLEEKVIIDSITKEFAVSYKSAKLDFERFVSELERKALIVGKK